MPHGCQADPRLGVPPISVIAAVCPKAHGPESAKPAREPNVRFRTSRPQSRPSEIHPTRHSKCHAAMASLGQGEKNSQRAYVFRIDPDSCRKRAVPALTFSARTGHKIASRIDTVDVWRFNWRGKPLVSYQVIVHLIAATTTKTSLEVRSELDATTYPPGVKVSDDEPQTSTLSDMTSAGNATIRSAQKPRLCSNSSRTTP